jgi:hypothetical protein
MFKKDINSKRRLIFSLLFGLPLALMLWTESCSQMQSANKSLNAFYSSEENVCSDSYRPTIGFVSKGSEEVPFFSPFEIQKVYLDEDGLTGKTQASLQGQSIVVVIDQQCTPAPQSFSAQVLEQNLASSPSELAKKAYLFSINEPLSQQQIEDLAEKDPCVLGITKTGTIKTAALSLPRTNDPQINRQDHLSFTNFRHAYEHFVLKQTPTSLVTVGFVDTGIDCNHSDLKPQIIASCGYNALNTALAPTDGDGHGTHTAGLVNAVINNGIGLAGIGGPSVRVHGIKVMDIQKGTVQDAYDGIQYAISQNLDVINISLEAPVRLQSIEDAVADAVRAGSVVVMAAGNGAFTLSAQNPVSPALIGANLKGAITVGSIDTSTGDLSSFSNFGSLVEIAAPGAVNSFNGGISGGLYSTGPNNAYQRMMGTSQAAPIVSAAAALVIQFLKQYRVAYSPADIEQIILISTDTIPLVNVSGGRVLNFSKLVRNTYAFAGMNPCPKP